MNILVQEDNNKFINNLNNIETSHSIVVKNITGQLYQNYYQLKPQIVILMASKCNDKESLQFILDHAMDTKIFIYHHNDLDKSLLKLTGIYHLTDSKKAKENPEQKIIKLPKLINEQLYNKLGQENKSDDIVCFIDHISKLPIELSQKLYPATKLKIKLFNNPKVRHHQNLGALNEKQKSELLKSSKYFLCIDDHYLHEALACGCEILLVEDLPNLKSTKKFAYNKDFTESYVNFIEKLINEK